MSGLAIDTLRYVKRLRAVGFSEEQAEVQAEALSEAIRESLVTKADLNEALEKLRVEITAVGVKIDRAVDGLRVEAREAQANMLRWLAPLLLGQLAAMAALIKLL